LAHGLVGCGSRAPASLAAPTTTATSTPLTTTRVTISGNVVLTGIGETTQLTATATRSDNTTKDVTTDAKWFVVDARVATVSPGGLVTVVGLGATRISAPRQPWVRWPSTYSLPHRVRY
jgi:hypothetical protein